MLARAGLCVGQVVLVVGTFLPWLRSGRVARNSYAGGAALKRLVDVDGVVSAGLTVWPFVSMAAAAALLLVLLGHLRAGAAVGGTVGLYGAAVALWALASDGQGLIRPERVGPVVSLLGGAVSVAVLILVALTYRTPGRAR